mmetsp:Transcript_40645/g.41339  ORF Transcript_40645/g.41339 Transcript_40645/m.41339 type:complete len:214 (-) Transcript_40645:617-1258(-)
MQTLSRMNGGTGSHSHGMIQILWMFHDIHIRESRFIELEFKSSQDHGQGNRCFQHSKLIPNTFPCPAPERQIGIISRNLIGIQSPLPFPGIKPGPALDFRVDKLPRKSHRIKRVRLGPKLGIPVNVVQRNEHIHTSNNRGVLHTPRSLGQDIILPAPSDEEGRFGVHPQSFGNNETDVIHAFNILHGGDAIHIPLENPVNLLHNLGHAIGMFR